MTLTINPGEYGEQKQIADTLASQWSTNAAGDSFATAARNYRAIRQFLRFLAQKEAESTSELTPNLLRDFETYLIDVAPTLAAEYARRIWMLLGEMEDLPEDTTIFISHPPAIAHRSSRATEAVTDAELKLILRAARGDISKARYRILETAEEPRCPWWYETTAIYVLLLFETAMSMDVLKHLNFAPGSPTRVTDWAHSDGRFVEVTYRKLRGGTSPPAQLYSTEGDFSAGRLLRTLRDVTAEARQQVAEDERFRDVGPWLGLREPGLPMYESFPQSEGAVLVPIASILSLFARWLEHHDIEIETFEGARTSFRAIRPAAKYQRLRLTDTTGLHMVDLVDDHSVDVYSRRYMRNQRMMHDLGQVFRKDISGRAEEVARTFVPTVVTPDTSDDEADGLAAEALEGGLEFGLTACTTPTDSPMAGQRSGDLCGVAFRACLSCPSAIVSPRHVNRLQTIWREAQRQREVLAPPEWEAMWAETVAFIEQALDRLEPYAAQFPQEPANVLDIGLLGGDV